MDITVFIAGTAKDMHRNFRGLNNYLRSSEIKVFRYLFCTLIDELIAYSYFIGLTLTCH